MSTKEVNVSRDAADDPLESLKAHLETQFAAALEEAGVEGSHRTARVWRLKRMGLWAIPGTCVEPGGPGRILQVNQPALVHIVVDMDPVMCANVTGFAADFQLNIFTSNTQTMQPVPGLSTKRLHPDAAQSVPISLLLALDTLSGGLPLRNEHLCSSLQL